MAFDFVEIVTASGTAKMAGNNLTQAPDTLFVQASQMVVGPAGGPYVPIASGAGVPVNIEVGNSPVAVGNPVPSNTQQLGGVTVAVGIGASNTGTQRVAIASDQIATPVALADATANPTVALIGSFGHLWNGVTWDRAPGSAAAGATVNLGGLSTFTLASAAGVNATNVKGSAGKLHGIQLSNDAVSAFYLKLYDKATAPQVGVDTPVKTILIPANGGQVNLSWAKGVTFSNGIGFAISDSGPESGTGDTGATVDDVLVNLDYD